MKMLLMKHKFAEMIISKDDLDASVISDFHSQSEEYFSLG
jgi:hypothetical protein